MKQLSPGVYRWTAPHPEYRTSAEEVACYALTAPRGTGPRRPPAARRAGRRRTPAAARRPHAHRATD